VTEAKIRGLDPMYFDRCRSLVGALKWAGRASGIPRNAVDIGANVGQTLDAFVGWWPGIQVLSLEPLQEAFASLRTLADRLGNQAEVANIGVSDKRGSLTLNASRTQSTNSSFKKFNKTAETVAAHRGLRGRPSHLELGEEDDHEAEVQVDTLDNILGIGSSFGAAKLYSKIGLDLLKIDTQGWELQVLNGARAVLANTKVVLTEWQFDDVYGTPPPLYELDEILSDAGFRLWDIAHVYKDLNSMRTLWVDLVYAKPNRNHP